MRALRLLGVMLLAVSPGMAGQGVYVVAGAEPVQRTVNGLVQDVTPLAGGSWLVQVGTEPAPVAAGWRGDAAARRPDPAFLRVPGEFRLPGDLLGRLPGRGDPFERATAVLAWVQRRVRIEEEERAPQDARAVLLRGSGRCSGLANAAVAALRGAGIPARTVSGILVTDGGPVPHRWLEAWLGEAGWVPSDPTLGLWVVTPRHVVCRAPAVGELSVVVRSLVEDDLASLPRRGRWACRPKLGARLTVRLRGMEAGAPAGRVILEGPGGERRVSAAGTAASFGWLPPGRWTVRLELRGHPIREFQVHLREGDVRSLTLQAPGEGRRS